MNTLKCRPDAVRKLNEHDPTVSWFYRKSCADGLLLEEKQFSSATTLRLVDLEELVRDNTMEPLNKRSLTGVQHQVRKKCSKIKKISSWWRKSPITSIIRCAGSYQASRSASGRVVTSISPDEFRRRRREEVRQHRNIKVESPIAAYELMDMKSEKIWKVIMEYLYRTLYFFWPNVIFLTVTK